MQAPEAGEAVSERSLRVPLRQWHLHVADLYEAPMTNLGADAAERWFTETKLSDFLTFTHNLAVTRALAWNDGTPF